MKTWHEMNCTVYHGAQIKVKSGHSLRFMKMNPMKEIALGLFQSFPKDTVFIIFNLSLFHFHDCIYDILFPFKNQDPIKSIA